MILAFVPCRLKSSRYPNKGIASIYGKRSIERSLMNVAAIPGIDKVILVTSSSEFDDALEECNLDGSVDVYRGSEEDVLERVIPALDKYKPKYLIRATGDCPLVSAELASILIEEHILSGADMTYTPSKVALGISCEVYTTSSIYKLRDLFPQTLYSEYLIYYFTNNPNIFKINAVEAPEKFIRPWRLTFDEPADLILLNLLFKSFDAKERTLSFDEVTHFFESNPSAAEINSGIVVKYRDNADLISFLKEATTFKKDEIL
jgi:spore coat polysaccharide biosynthesis protein SpsF (cytidylyltransferase family)